MKKYLCESTTTCTIRPMNRICSTLKKCYSYNYRDYIIKLNSGNIYDYKPATYSFNHKDETDGREGWGKTIDECIDKINEIYEN